MNIKTDTNIDQCFSPWRIFILFVMMELIYPQKQSKESILKNNLSVKFSNASNIKVAT